MSTFETFSLYNADNFIRNCVTLVDSRRRKLTLPPMQRQTLVAKTGDAPALPIDIDELMMDLRIDSEDVQPIVERLCLAASAFLERRTGYVIVPSQFTVLAPCWWTTEPLHIDRGPFREVIEVAWLSAPNTWEPVDPSNYFAMQTTDTEFIVKLLSTFERPQLWSELPQVRLKFTAGFVSPDESDFDGMVLEDGLKQVLIALVAHYFQNVELFEADKIADVENSAGSLLQAYRKYW